MSIAQLAGQPKAKRILQHALTQRQSVSCLFVQRTAGQRTHGDGYGFCAKRCSARREAMMHAGIAWNAENSSMAINRICISSNRTAARSKSTKFASCRRELAYRNISYGTQNVYHAAGRNHDASSSQ